MLSRIVFFVGFGLILTVAAGFLVIALFFGDRSSVESRAVRSPSAESLMASGGFEGGTLGWSVKGQLVEAASGRLVIEFTVRDSRGQPLPEATRIDVTLEMVEHAMPPIQARVELLRPGEYRASATVSMAGRWRVRIDLPDGMYRFLTKAEI